MQLEIDEMIEDGRYSGCTCTSALIYGNKLYVANLGDSRIVLVKEKEYKQQKDSLFPQEQVGQPEMNF